MIKVTKQMIEEKVWALNDLIHIKETGRYNEYVTEDNIHQWISGQEYEINYLKKLYNQQQKGEK